MTLKHLVLALTVAMACAVAPSAPHGSTEAVGDTFEMSPKEVAENDAALALTPKLRGAAEEMASRPAGRALDFGTMKTDEPTPSPTTSPTPSPTCEARRRAQEAQAKREADLAAQKAGAPMTRKLKFGSARKLSEDNGAALDEA
jgi:hypothetical protein